MNAHSLKPLRDSSRLRFVIRFDWLSGLFAAILMVRFPLYAQPDPPSRPILFVHGWCGSYGDWQPLFSYLADTLPSSMYPNPNIYVIQYNSQTNSYSIYREKQPFTDPPNLELLSQQEISAIPSSTRFFVIQFYDPNPQSTAPTDPSNVARISVLNKAYEIKKAIGLLKSITRTTSVNVVAHSMGGVDARAYVENMASKDKCYNYDGDYPYYFGDCSPGGAEAAYDNDVANIITVDTPHSGSPLAATLDSATLLALNAVGDKCQAWDNTNRIELSPLAYGGYGLLESLNYSGAPINNVLPSVNIVPIQTISNYFSEIPDVLGSWTGLQGPSDDAVPLASQSVPRLGDQNNTAPLANTSFPHTESDIVGDSTCWISRPLDLPMLHNMTCVGALSAPQRQIEAQIEKDNWLWVTSWTDMQSPVSFDAGVRIKYSAVDNGGYAGANLSKIRLWRAPDNAGLPGAWELLANDPDPGSTLAEGSFTDRPSAPSTYWYDVDVLDTQNNEAREPIWFPVKFDSGSSTTYALTVHSSNPASGVKITVTPEDGNGTNSGATTLSLAYYQNTQVVLTAPSTAGGAYFSSWTGCDQATGFTCTVTITRAISVTANYSTSAVTHTLTVNSANPASGVVITASPADNITLSSGTTAFTLTYDQGTQVSLTAPTSAGGNNFSSWTGCDLALGATCTVNISADRAVTADYSTPLVTGEWAWMNGSDIANASSVYGTTGVPDSANSPGARMGSTTWTDKSGNLWLFGGCNSGCAYGGFNDLWEFNPTTNEWTSISANQDGVYGTLGEAEAANVPPGRWGATSWVDTSGKLWLFGGFGYSDTDSNTFYFNDLWNYDPSVKEWMWVSGAAGAVDSQSAHGTQGDPGIDNTPGNRYGSVGWADKSGNFWLFGGFGLDASHYYYPLSELWMFNPATKEWTWLSGGEATDAVYGKEGAPAVGNNPGSRYGSASWTDQNGVFWLFGGTGFGAAYPGGTLNDLWKYDPTLSEWTWVGGANTVSQPGIYGTQGVAAAGNIPGARTSSTGWIDASGTFWLFGGNGYDSAGNSVYLNDLWNFSPTSQEWNWVNGYSTLPARGVIPGVYGSQGTPAASSAPGSRVGAVSWTDKSGNLWLFGGMGYDSIGTNGGGAYLNDLWEFRQFTGRLSSISVSPTNITLSLSGTQQFIAAGTYSDGSTQNLTGTVAWTSSNTSVATISSIGIVTAIAGGSSYISASYNGISSGTAVLSVVSPVSTTTTLGSSQNPSTYSQTVTITATVAATSGTATPTGTMRFSIDGIPEGSAVTLSGGLATYSTSLLAVGTHSIAATYSPSTGSTFTASSATALSQVVNKATPSITWATPAAITYGAKLSSTQLDATSSTPGTWSYNPAAGTVLNAGSQKLTATLAPTDMVDYTQATATVQLTVNPATQTISFTALKSPVAYGASPITLSASATSKLPVTFSVLSGPGTVAGSVLTITGAGTVVVAADQSGNATYQAAPEVTQSLVVNRVPLTATATNVSIMYGSAIPQLSYSLGGFVNGDTQKSATTGTPALGTAATATSSVGNYPITIAAGTFSAPNYSVSYVNGTITVTKGTPAVTWPTPAAISYGTALSSTQLDASSKVAGTFAYSPAAGTLPKVGSQLLTVTFTPTDNPDYTTATASVTLVVNKAKPAITWATPAAITYGTALSATQLNAASTTKGSFAYSPASGTVLKVGQQTLSTTLTPTDTADYTTATATVQLTVNQATPAIKWNTPAAITYGTKLSATQLDATSTAPGTFSYTPAAGTVLSSGSQTLTAKLTPTDGVDYAQATATVQLKVNPASQTISFTAPAATATYGAAPISLTATASSGLGVTFTVTGPATLSGSTLSITGAGTIKVTASQAGNSNYAAATAVSHSITVNKAAATAKLSASPASGASGTSIALTATLTGVTNGASPTGTVTFKSGSTTLGTGTLSGGTATLKTTALPLGTDSVTASYGGDANYNAATSSAVSIKIGPTAQTITFSALPSSIAYGSAPLSLTATASSGLAVSYSVTGPATVTSGKLTATGLGKVTVTASQSGNSQYGAAQAVQQSTTVVKGTPTVTVTSSANPAKLGASVTLTATLTNIGATMPTGKVTFLYGTSTLGTGTLNNAKATLSLTTLPAGQDSITASYAGDTNYSGESSAALKETVNKATTAMVPKTLP